MLALRLEVSLSLVQYNFILIPIAQLYKVYSMIPEE